MQDNALDAVELYASFPFHSATFDDGYLHGEIVRHLMRLGLFDHPRLQPALIACVASCARAIASSLQDGPHHGVAGGGRVCGDAGRQVQVLPHAARGTALQSSVRSYLQIYAAINNKAVDDPALQAFFKFKCW